MSKTTNTTTNIKDVIREIKEYQAMQDELKKQINELKEEAIEWLDENELDEILTDEGKITYREVISKRFNSTAFKKDFADIYDEYTTQTSNMRFTCK
jgi:predicted phage-related endonuclease